MNELYNCDVAGRLNNYLGALTGVRVIVDNNLPEFKPFLELKPSVPVSDECRQKTNKYLLDRFGSRRFVTVFNGDYLVHQNTLNFIRDNPK